MTDVKFICAQPAIEYYTWQVEVMIQNFMAQGVNPNNIEIVAGYHGTIPQSWLKLAGHYNYVRFFFYPDNRLKPGYISSIRPHILYQHWKAFPELANATVFYHDCDIVLARPVDFSMMLNDEVCYVSDTVSYIGANYIRSKGEHYLDMMTDLVGVSKDYVIEQESNSGGAQYLIKKVPADFWLKVYSDSENLFRIVNKQIDKDKPDHALQIWCADMWAVLWNLWFYDKSVIVTPDLSFSWGTSGIAEWDKHPIYHNAGVTSNDLMFYKADYMTKLPYDLSMENLSDQFCAYNYAKIILNTKTVLI
jgi:hypothetical protein